MTINEATEIVTKAALANANGHTESARITEAVELLRAYVRDQEEP